MAYCPPRMLEDISGVLVMVRTWPGVVERKPGIFYVNREPFLHFHRVAGGERRADVKGRRGWSKIVLPIPLPAGARRTFVRTLTACYRERAVAVSPARAARSS